MRAASALGLLIVTGSLVAACNASEPTAVTAVPSTSSVAVQTDSPSPSPSYTDLSRGDLFPLPGLHGAWEGRYTTTKDIKGIDHVTINIVAVGDRPGFQPSIITATPGQRIELTVYQSDDLSADFQHNFSIDRFGIDKDIPIGAGHEVTFMVRIPATAGISFYCKYHVAGEQHGGVIIATS